MLFSSLLACVLPSISLLCSTDSSCCSDSSTSSDSSEGDSGRVTEIVGWCKVVESSFEINGGKIW